MKMTITKIAGWLLVLIGVLVVVFSERIVIPAPKRLVVIETISGRQHVVYRPDGSHYQVSFNALCLWIFVVAVIGICICLSGGVLLYLARRSAHKISDEKVHDHAA
jgi:hypothetical protein